MNEMIELTEEEMMTTNGGLGGSQFGKDFPDEPPVGGRHSSGGGGANYLCM